MLVWPARCASQPKNVQARRAPAGGSIRPGLNIAEHLPRTPGRLSGTGRTDPNSIAAPPKGNLSKVSPRDSRFPSSAFQSGVLAVVAQPESTKGTAEPSPDSMCRTWQTGLVTPEVNFSDRHHISIAILSMYGAMEGLP